jgi:ABC-type metal ion transport system substrate-binding protein
MEKPDYSKRDIRNNFANIERTLISLYSAGSIELQNGRYITENDLNSLEENFKNYSFIS